MKDDSGKEVESGVQGIPDPKMFGVPCDRESRSSLMPEMRGGLLEGCLMTREEIPFKYGFPGQCVMCKIAIGAEDQRVAVYEVEEGKRREYVGMLCPTCAKITRKDEEKVVVTPDIEEIIGTYEKGIACAKKRKLEIPPDVMMKAAISVYIQSRR